MRIGLEVSVAQFNAAGTARYSVELARALREGDFAGCEIVELRAGNQRLPEPGLARKLFVLWWEWVYCPILLPRCAQQLQLELLHCTAPMPLGSLAHTRLVTSLHDVIPYSHPQWFSRVMGWRLRRWIAQAARQSIHLIASSHYTAQQIGAHLKVAPQNLSVVYLGKTVPVELMDRKTVSAPFLLTVGTLEPRKNLRATLEAYALLKRRMPGVPPLLVIGRQGWGDVNVRHWIAEHQLEQDVRLLGGVSDARLFDLYRTAAALVYPSLQEGFGFPPLEAMACGCPVITANVASLPEVVGEAALLIEPHQPEAIADAVQRVLTDAALADRLRRAGRARAELFSWERCARETLAVYRRVMAGAAAPEIAGA